MRFVKETNDEHECPSFCLEYREDKESGFAMFFADVVEKYGYNTCFFGDYDSEKNTSIISMYISNKTRVPYGSYKEAWDELRDIYKTAKKEYIKRQE